jgi:hypothetical protein
VRINKKESRLAESRVPVYGSDVELESFYDNESDFSPSSEYSNSGIPGSDATFVTHDSIPESFRQTDERILTCKEYMYNPKLYYLQTFCCRKIQQDLYQFTEQVGSFSVQINRNINYTNSRRSTTLVSGELFANALLPLL